MTTNDSTAGVPHLPPPGAMDALSKLANDAGISAPLPVSQDAFAASATPGAKIEDALTPDEIQILKEMALVRSRQKVSEFVLPDKPVTEEDKQRFAESIFNRKPYAEKMVLIPNKFEIVFRCKTRREREAIEAQIDKDFADHYITNERKYAATLNNYNLMVQMTHQNGALVTSPVSKLIDPEFSLRTFVDSHIINTLPEPAMFILTGALAQFENRVAFMQRQILEQNFSQPADPS